MFFFLITIFLITIALGHTGAMLYRKLKQATDRSPSELIRENRLARAHAVLEQGAGPVSEVGYAFAAWRTFQMRFSPASANGRPACGRTARSPGRLPRSSLFATSMQKRDPEAQTSPPTVA